jgi:hypothetical protein
MILTLVFALGLPIWLVIEQLARLREGHMPARQTREAPGAARAPESIGVALSGRSA